MPESPAIGPVRFTVGPFDTCVERIIAGPPTHVHFVNAYTVALADTRPQYAALLNTGLCLTDGMPVAWVGRRAYGLPAEQWPRVYGPDVMEAVLARGGTHYLLGGSPQTLATLQEVIARRWPQALLAGAESPPFRALTLAERRSQDERILASEADFVWVGLGTPKQDWEAARITASTGTTTLAVGAAFDFLAGTKPQAPDWMQRSGLEWAFRLGCEPRRLARRYLWGNPRFLLASVRTHRWHR